MENLKVYCVLNVLAALLSGVSANWCYFDLLDEEETYCSDGCCYSTNSCCKDDFTYSSIPVIVGCSVGGFFFLVVVIAAICACVKSGTRSGRVVTVASPVSVNAVAVTSSVTPRLQQGYNAYPAGTQPLALQGYTPYPLGAQQPTSQTTTVVSPTY